MTTFSIEGKALKVRTFDCHTVLLGALFEPIKARNALFSVFLLKIALNLP